jgi:hypothetical protein
MKASLKEQHEKSIGRNLVQLLRYRSKFIGRGVAGVQPDLIYSIADRTIGIEIATAYNDDDQAKVEWQLARGRLKPGTSRFIKLGSWTAPDKLIAARVQQELHDKSSKNYSKVDAVWLCIYQNAPIVDLSETLDLARALKLPLQHPFERIYLCWYAHAGEGGGFRACVVFDKTCSNEIRAILGLPKLRKLP